MENKQNTIGFASVSANDVRMSDVEKTRYRRRFIHSSQENKPAEKRCNCSYCQWYNVPTDEEVTKAVNSR